MQNFKCYIDMVCTFKTVLFRRYSNRGNAKICFLMISQIFRENKNSQISFKSHLYVPTEDAKYTKYLPYLYHASDVFYGL
jgi:hypothetical protein